MLNKTKNIFLVKLFTIACLYLFFDNSVSAQWVVTPSQPISTEVSEGWRVDCDINSSHYAIVYGHQQNVTSRPVNVGVYLKIFDINNNPTTGDIYVFNQGENKAFVQLTQSNEVVVLGYNANVSNNTNDLVLKKYNINGILQSSINVFTGIGSNFVDLTVMGNNDVLVSLFDSNNDVIIRCYNSNLVYKSSITVATNISKYSAIHIRSAFLDSYNNEFIVGYSKGNTTSTTSTIKKYSYSSVNPVWSQVLNNISFNGGFVGNDISSQSSSQIALKPNGDIVYIDGNNGVMVSSPPVYNSSLLSTQQGEIKVDEQNRLLLSWTTSQRGKAVLFDNQNNIIHNYDEGGKITGYSSAAIHDCMFLFAGDDGKKGSDFHTTRPPYKQIFNCSNCGPLNQAKAVASFVNPSRVVQMNSKYGLGDVAVLCLSDSLLVDGSKSTCENGYFVGLSEFDLMNWQDIGNPTPLFSDWVALTTAPSNIKITDFLPQGYQLRPNRIYKFRLAVGPQWDATDIFFKIDCCSSSEGRHSAGGDKTKDRLKLDRRMKTKKKRNE